MSVVIEPNKLADDFIRVVEHQETSALGLLDICLQLAGRVRALEREVEVLKEATRPSHVIYG